MCLAGFKMFKKEDCSCGGHHSGKRHFLTHNEQMGRLEEYRTQLELELDGVKEEIEKLRKN